MTPQENAERRRFLGASEAGAVIGVNPYQSAWDVYAEKTGVEIDKSDLEERLWFGSASEEMVRRRYAMNRGVEVETVKPVVHPLHPWLRASPDGLVTEEDGERGGLEIKTVTTFQDHLWGVAGTDEVPPHVRLQCEVGMACTGLPWWDVAALFGTFTMRTYRVLRADAEYEEALIEALSAFWHDHVLAQDPPPMDGSEGARAWLRKMYPRDEREPRKATTLEELQAIEEYVAAKQAEKETKARLSAARNTLALHVGDAGGLMCAQGTIYYRANKNGVRSFRTKMKGVSDE